jgi:hypothetical protein
LQIIPEKLTVVALGAEDREIHSLAYIAAERTPPIAPQPAHVFEPALPLGMNAMTLGEHILQDDIDFLVRLLPPRHPVVGSAVAPVGLSHLGRMDNVFAPVVGP